MTGDNPTIRKTRRAQPPKPSPVQDSELTTYYKTISAMGKAAMADKKAKGERMHLAPIGWLNGRDEHGRSILIADPERYELLLEARDQWENGVSLRKICGMLKEKGFRTKRGKLISPASLRHGIKAACNPRFDLNKKIISNDTSQSQHSMK